MEVRIGAAQTAEHGALAGLLVQIGRLPRPSARRALLEAVWDTYAVGVPARRTHLLRGFLAEAEQIERAARRSAARAKLAAFTREADGG